MKDFGGTEPHFQMEALVERLCSLGEEGWEKGIHLLQHPLPCGLFQGEHVLSCLLKFLFPEAVTGLKFLSPADWLGLGSSTPGEL